jgi:DNA-binding response OmpR family regulator
LIAEDDPTLGELLAAVLMDQGYTVIGVARTVTEAVILALEHKPDLAVLDLHLAEGGLGTEIVAELKDPAIGVLYATSHTDGLTAADGHACLQKPYLYPDLLRGLEVVRDMLSPGQAISSIPDALRMLRPPAKSEPVAVPESPSITDMLFGPREVPG